MFMFTRYSMDADESVSVANLPPVRFIGVTTSQGIKGKIQGS